MLDDMESALGQYEWLADGSYSLADAALTPFVERLDELNFTAMWEDLYGPQSPIGGTGSRPVSPTIGFWEQHLIPKDHNTGKKEVRPGQGSRRC